MDYGFLNSPSTSFSDLVSRKTESVSENSFKEEEFKFHTFFSNKQLGALKATVVAVLHDRC